MPTDFIARTKVETTGSELQDRFAEEVWTVAEKHLLKIQFECVEHGSLGVSMFVHDVKPLVDRLNSGERTQHLLNSIMKLKGWDK